MSTVRIYNPVGSPAEGERVELSRFPAAGETLRLGILENTKPNAKQLMRGVAEEVQRRWSDAEDIVVERKRSAAEGVDDLGFDRVRQLGLVFVGSGD